MFGKLLTKLLIKLEKHILSAINAASNKFIMTTFFILFFAWIFFAFWIGSLFSAFLDVCIQFSVIPLSIFLDNFTNPLFIYCKFIIKSVFAGVITIIGFIPIVFCIFWFINFSQSCGYIEAISNRINFALQKYFKMDSKVFIPVITGMGCTVPAYIATSIIKNKKERFLANLLLSFVPCSAKHTVFVLFCVNLLGHVKGSIALFCIYIFGFIFGLLVIKIVSLFINLPPKPNLQNQQISCIYNFFTRQNLAKAYKPAIYKMTEYIKGISSGVLLFSLFFAIFNSFGFNSENGFYLSYNSSTLLLDSSRPTIIMALSKFLADTIFAPLDLPWEIVFGIVAGFSAKEISISALGVVFSSNILSFDGNSIVMYVVNNFSLRVVIEFLSFMFFYMPCVSATITLKRQSNKYLEVMFVFLITTTLAYGSCYLIKILFGLF